MKFIINGFEVDIKARKVATEYPETRANKDDLNELLGNLFGMAHDAREQQLETWGKETTLSRRYKRFMDDFDRAFCDTAKA